MLNVTNTYETFKEFMNYLTIIINYNNRVVNTIKVVIILLSSLLILQGHFIALSLFHVFDY